MKNFDRIELLVLMEAKAQYLTLTALRESFKCSSSFELREIFAQFAKAFGVVVADEFTPGSRVPQNHHDVIMYLAHRSTSPTIQDLLK